MPGQALFHKPQPLKRAHFIAHSFTQILFLLICVCLGRKKFLSILVTTKKSHRNPGPGFQYLCPLDDIIYVNISRSGHCMGLPFHTCSLSPTPPSASAHLGPPDLLHHHTSLYISIKSLHKRYKIGVPLLLCLPFQ